jgi:glucose/arabinose dehydrogenase
VTLAPVFLLASLVLQPLVTGLDRPVQAVSAHDGSGRLYVAQQGGKVLTLEGRTLLAQPFLDLATLVSCCDNGGLLSVAFHPNYGGNGQFFVLYVDHNGDTVVARYTRSSIDPLRADPTSREVLLLIDQPADNVPNHHGGTLQFGPDGFLYVSIGDGGAYVSVTNRAQELHHLLGKLLRINVDGARPYTIPPDNPFAGRFDARGEIWSYGLRNPWRFSFDRTTGELLLGDVGQDSWEEIDITTISAARGANFGWPLMEATHCFPPGEPCSTAGLTLPKLEYPRAEGCSVTGGYRYRGTQWPRMAGVYFYGDWCSGTLWGAVEGSPAEVVAQTGKAIVSFGEDDAGELYLVDYNGGIYRITAPGSSKHRAVRH